jgi:hypothetical protein
MVTPIHSFRDEIRYEFRTVISKGLDDHKRAGVFPLNESRCDRSGPGHVGRRHSSQGPPVPGEALSARNARRAPDEKIDVTWAGVASGAVRRLAKG